MFSLLLPLKTRKPLGGFLYNLISEFLLNLSACLILYGPCMALNIKVTLSTKTDMEVETSIMDIINSLEHFKCF
jgi:hypothetical protein